MTAVMLAGLSGCCCSQVKWFEPVVVAPRIHAGKTSHGKFAEAERIYAAAIESEESGHDGCVDLYYQVALLTANHQTCFTDDCRGYQLHTSALLKLVTVGQSMKRLDPHRGLTVKGDGIEQLIPIDYRGFTWQREQFDHLIPVGDYQTTTLSVKNRCPGVGVPLVVKRCGCQNDRSFLPPDSHFAATLRLRRGATPRGGVSLVLYDPMRIKTAKIGTRLVPLAKDVTAPLAYALRGETRSFLNSFFYADRSLDAAHLYMLEPFQPNKIPLVLVHGLLSDPYTWADTVNQLRGAKGLLDDYQIWVFEYPTGEPFLSSAAQLRDQLRKIRIALDPGKTDEALSNMVLVGHSMGGILSKLQVTYSGDRLWQSVANRPFEQVVMDDKARADLDRIFHFQPSDSVSRVVFMAAPHRGSLIARRCIGRIGASLVQMPEEDRREHDRLMADNPGVFSEEVRDRIPTSIDLLDPDSQLLKAIEHLPLNVCTSLHSIIGDRCGSFCHGRSDGVVLVSSAREPQAASEILVDAKHSKVKDHPDSIAELLRILYEHRQQVEGCEKM